MSHRPIPQDYSGPVTFTIPEVHLPHVDHRTLAASPLLTVYDAVDVAAIPAWAQFLLGYLDGAWPNYSALRARFPTAQILGVTVTGAHQADIGDCEGGDMSTASTAAELRAGSIRMGYSADSNFPAIRDAHGGLFPWWAAEPNGVQHVNPFSVATQYAWPGYGSPGNYDMSATDGVFIGWTKPAPAPPPAPLPTPPKESTMIDTPRTGGILVARPDGSVDAFDGARFYGSMAGQPLNAPIVGIAATPTGNGYWLLGADAGIFNFGDAKYLGPRPALRQEWNIGVGRAIPLVGIATGCEPGIAYTLVGDVPGSVEADLYRISADGSMA